MILYTSGMVRDISTLHYIKIHSQYTHTHVKILTELLTDFYK